MSKRAAEQVEAQNRYEATEQANVERVRREREAERERLAELEVSLPSQYIHWSTLA